MQVFEIFQYNLKDIKFKDNKNYLDSLLGELNLNYTDIMCCFDEGFSGERCRKITKVFPQLSKYVQRLEESALYFRSAPMCFFSSIKNSNGQIEKYINSEHVDDFSALLKKIPNPINFWHMGVVLDNINWYKDEFQNPVFSPSAQNMHYYKPDFSSYFSNSIRFFKDYDFGNKFNLIEVVIERKISEDELEQYPDVFNELLARLGTPIKSRLECVFNYSENERWLNASKKFEEFVGEKSKNIYVVSNDEQNKTKEDYLIDSITPIKGFSPKTVFNKIAKTKRYKYCYYKNGCYRYQHINLNNHIFTVELMNIPFSSFFDATVWVEGYNFMHAVCNTQQVTINNSISAELFAKEVFNIGTEAENKYAERLLSLYGKTPKWYIK